MNRHILLAGILALTMTSCNDFLTRDPMDTVTDTPDFWNSEENIRTSVYNFYTTYFPGYRSGWNRADWFSQTNVADWTDDNAQQQATFFDNAAPTTASSTSWDFDNVRNINLLINRISSSTLDDEAREHWLGVARFLRGMEYASLVEKFGDVPYYQETLSTTDYEQLYKARDPRELVMDSVLSDLNYAVAHIRLSDGTDQLSINRDVANAFASRIMLFEGTWQKYNENNSEYAKKYLNAAKEFATNVMDRNVYSLCDDYKALTTSVDLADNPEVIIYRSYVEGVVTHSLMSFQNTEHEIDSPSKSLIDSYLSSNGLPINQEENTLYQGDKWFFDEIKDRDPRLYAVIDTTGPRVVGAADVWAISGYFGNRFVNPSLVESAGGRSNTNITDAPVMKYNEVLLNYIEAAAELASLGDYTLTQEDFDNTINVLRDRPSTSMPHVELNGDYLAVNGVNVNDPNRDSDVSPIIWEIRRERRTELAYEGIRFNDIRRWGKLWYADMVQNPTINRGVWVDKEQLVEWYNSNNEQAITVDDLDDLVLDGSDDAGYIQPIQSEALMRTVEDRDYLYPIPVDQITLYEAHGSVLEQNPGW